MKLLKVGFDSETGVKKLIEVKNILRLLNSNEYQAQQNLAKNRSK